MIKTFKLIKENTSKIYSDWTIQKYLIIPYCVQTLSALLRERKITDEQDTNGSCPNGSAIQGRVQYTHKQSN